MSVPEIERGTRLARFDGDPDPHEVGCLLHRGAQPISTEHRIDPDTGKPRIRTTFVEGEERPLLNPDTGETVLAEFPIYAEDQGYQPDCEACRLSMLNTYEHVLMKAMQRQLVDVERERARLRWDL